MLVIKSEKHRLAIQKINAAADADRDAMLGWYQVGLMLIEAHEDYTGTWEAALREGEWTKSVRWADRLRGMATYWNQIGEAGYDPTDMTMKEFEEKVKQLSGLMESAKEGDKSTVAALPMRGHDISPASGAGGGNGRAKLGGGVRATDAKGKGAGISGRPASPAAKPRPASDVIDTKVWQRENAAYRIVERLKVTLSTMEADFTKLFAEAEGADVRGRLMRMLDNKDIVAFLADVRTVVKLYGPQWPCPLPHKGASCSQCKNRGYVNEEQYKALPPELMRRLGGKTK
jgi:hypothetical protein